MVLQAAGDLLDLCQSGWSQARYSDAMTNAHSPLNPSPAAAPLADFSQCHLGILTQLHDFVDLPELQAAAIRARSVAAKTLSLFAPDGVRAHHADEEKELFPAVLRDAEPGVERDHVQAMIERLTSDHRAIEALMQKLQPMVKAVGNGKPVDLEQDVVDSLVRAYVSHAHFEEQQFLPLAQTILGRNSRHLAALGLSLHLRHAPQVVGHI